VFGGAITYASCCKRAFVRLGWNVDADYVGLLAMITSNPGSQACAGTQHGDISGEHVAYELIDAGSASHRSQMLDEQ
jgi:hypothetical protein